MNDYPNYHVAEDDPWLVTVYVEQRHIDAAKRAAWRELANIHKSCPDAQALNEVFNFWGLPLVCWTVHPNWAFGFGRDRVGVSARLPFEERARISRWDVALEMDPHSFEVKLEPV